MLSLERGAKRTGGGGGLNSETGVNTLDPRCSSPEFLSPRSSSAEELRRRFGSIVACSLLVTGDL